MKTRENAIQATNCTGNEQLQGNQYERFNNANGNSNTANVTTVGNCSMVKAVKLTPKCHPGRAKTEVKFVNAVTAGGSVKFFASGVNISRNNAIYNINESTKYILP